jgi:hypothetical protein
MSAATPVRSTEEAKGASDLRQGGLIGLGGAGAAVVVPLVLLWLATGHAGGFLGFTPGLVSFTGLLVVAGAALLLVSVFLYRRGFSHLRHVDRRFRAASALCLLGSVGLIALLAAGAIVAADPSQTGHCIESAPSHAVDCLRAVQPYGAYLGLAGFWLAWAGALGLVVGFALAGTRFDRPELSVAAVLYAALLGVLVGPAAELLTPVPGARYLLLTAPALAVLAPLLVVAAGRRPFRPSARPGR